jgi:Flp pilus assembly protein TadB
MAEPQETRQEKESRWATQRTTRDQEQRERQAVQKRKTTRTWFIVGAIGIIVAVLVKIVLL